MSCGTIRFVLEKIRLRVGIIGTVTAALVDG